MIGKRNYVVIGSNSFSGGYMVDELMKNETNYVVGISRSPEKTNLYLPYQLRPRHNFEYYQVDMLREPDKLINLIDIIRPEYVINFASLTEVAVSVFRPLDYFETNCISLVNFCNQLRTRRYLKQYIHVSTAEVYGNCESPVVSSALLDPTTPYAASKAAADLYLKSLFKVFNFPVMFIRSTNVYGKHQQLYKVIPRTMIYLKTGRKIDLHADGKMVRCFVHIRDVISGIIKAMELGKPGEVYHFSTEKRTTIAEIIEKICILMGRDFKSVTNPVEGRPGSDLQYLLEQSKTISELKWNPEFSLEKGLKEVLDWIEDRWEEIVNEPHIYMHRP